MSSKSRSGVTGSQLDRRGRSRSASVLEGRSGKPAAMLYGDDDDSCWSPFSMIMYMADLMYMANLCSTSGNQRPGG